MQIFFILLLLSSYIQFSSQDIIDTECTIPLSCQPSISAIWFPGEKDAPIWSKQKQYIYNWTVNTNSNLILYRRGADDLRTNWNGLLASGMIDIMLWTSVYTFKDYAYDLTDIVHSQNWTSRFPNRLLELHSYNHKYYGLPDRYGFWGIWYSKKTFAKYNITITATKTWDEFKFICSIFQKSSQFVAPIGLGIGDLWQPEVWFEHLALNNGGIDWWDKLQKGEIPFTSSDPVINQTYTILNQFKELGFFPNATILLNEKATLNDLLRSWIKQDRYAMVLMSSIASAYGNLNPNDDFDFFPFPVINQSLINQNVDNNNKTGQFSTSYVWLINKNSRQINLAIDLIQFMAQDTYGSISLPYLTGYSPPQTGLRQNLSSDVLKRGFNMLEQTNKVYVFIDNTIPDFSAATRPSGVAYFTDQIDSDTMISRFEKVRVEKLLGQVAPPIISISLLSYVTLTAVTINSTLYIKINILSFTSSNNIMSVNDLNNNVNATMTTIQNNDSLDNWIVYSSPISIPKSLYQYKIEAYARYNFMIDSEIVNLIYDSTGDDSSSNNRKMATKYKIDDPGMIALFTLTSIIILATLILIGVIYLNHKEPVIRASSPIFCLLILIGCIVGYISVFLTLLEQCIAASILGHFAFYFVFSALFMKTYRIMIIFNAADKLATVSILDSQLLMYMSIGFLAFGGLITGWMIMDPPLYIHISTVDSIMYFGCSCKQYLGWNISIVVIEFFMLLCGIYLAYKTRKIPDLFNESLWISNSIATILLVATIIILLDKTNLIRSDVLIFLWSIGMLLATFMTMMLIFVPKVIILYSHSNNVNNYMNQKSQKSNNSGTMTGGTGTMTGTGTTGQLGQPGQTGKVMMMSMSAPLSYIGTNVNNINMVKSIQQKNTHAQVQNNYIYNEQQIKKSNYNNNNSAGNSGNGADTLAQSHIQIQSPKSSSTAVPIII